MRTSTFSCMLLIFVVQQSELLAQGDELLPHDVHLWTVVDESLPGHKEDVNVLVDTFERSCQSAKVNFVQPRGVAISLRLGDSITETQLVEKIKDAPFTPNPDRTNTIVLYMKVHGTVIVDPSAGFSHLLQLQNKTLKEPVRSLTRRSAILHVLKEKAKESNTVLTVLLTDSCASSDGQLQIAMNQAPVSRFQTLFLDSRGVVDMNASTFQPNVGEFELAWDTSDGGTFTQSLLYCISDPKPVAGWQPFYLEVQKKTNEEFLKLQANFGNPLATTFSERALGKQKQQTPWVVSGELPENPLQPKNP